MRPYLAIIKDSFREALSSYVLWALFLILTSLLVVLMPFSYSEQLVGELPWSDIVEPRVLLMAIKEGSQSDGPSPSKHIYGKLDKNLQKKIDKLWDELQEIAEDETPDKQKQGELGMQVVGVLSQLQANLNELLKEKDFYDQASWSEVELTDEGKELVATKAADLPQARLQRRNRLLLEAAYPVLIRKSVGVEFRPTFMGRAIAQIPVLGAPSATTKEAVVQWYQGYIGWLMNWVVTTIIVFVGIIFTSAIIPRMFEPGSISLLLSKPVRRSYLYIAKFFGGCAFMLLSAAYVVTGVYLLAGIRVGIWEPRVFACIPLFTMIFAVYYAVSAYVGAVWRSAIVAVLATIAFYWLVALVGFAKVNLADTFLDATRMVDVVEAGETVIAVDETESAYFWDQEANEWKNTFQRPMAFGMARTKKPLIYDEQNHRLISTAVSYNIGGMVLAVGPDEEAWQMQEGVALPPGTLDVFMDSDGKLLAISPLGFFRLEGEALPEDEPPVEEEPNEADDEETASEEDPAGMFDSPFELVGPDKPLDVAGPMAVAMNRAKQSIAVYTGGVVAVYNRDKEGNYIRSEKKELAGSEQKAATLAFAGSTLIIGRDDGQLFVLDAKTLRQLHEYSPEGKVPPRFIEASADGKWFAILFQDRKLWLYDATEQKLNKASLWSQGDISAVAFTGDDSLLVIDRVARVREMELPSLNVVRTMEPNELPQFGEGYNVMGMNLGFMTFYRGLLVPLYTVLPRPGELGWTMNYVMTGKKTSTWDDKETPGVGRSADISSHQHAMRDPWTPVLSCSIFVAVMLALGCWYIERSEF